MRTRQRLLNFESMYDMVSREFQSRFENGDLEESLDFIEWAGELRTLQMLNIQKQALLGIRLN